MGGWREATETERRDRQTKGTAATPANPGLLPLIASLVFSLEWFQSREAHDDPAKVGRFAFAEVSVKYVVCDWLLGVLKDPLESRYSFDHLCFDRR